MRLLIVEDEKPLARSVRRILSSEYVIDVAFTGKRGLHLAFTHEYDLIMLDLTLPDMSGLELCQELRRSEHAAPILILTAKETVESKVLLLNAGADDYLVKPYQIAELRARLRALLRRSGQVEPSIITKGQFRLNQAAHTIFFNGQPLKLSKKEFLLLAYLLKHNDQPVSRPRLLEHVWDGDLEGLASNTVDVHVSNVRKQIGRPLGNRVIRTVHGTGYMVITGN
jgi:two-component system, OmpR family, response regulator